MTPLPTGAGGFTFERARDQDTATSVSDVPVATSSRPRLLTTAQAAVFLTLKESTVRDYARRGIVPSVKLGRHVRFVEADLVTYLDALRRSAPGVHLDLDSDRRQPARL